MKTTKRDAYYARQLMLLRQHAPVEVIAALPDDGLFCIIHLDDGPHAFTIPPPRVSQWLASTESKASAG